jgi:hypothetical protein
MIAITAIIKTGLWNGVFSCALLILEESFWSHFYIEKKTWIVLGFDNEIWNKNYKITKKKAMKKHIFTRRDYNTFFFQSYKKKTLSGAKGLHAKCVH